MRVERLPVMMVLLFVLLSLGSDLVFSNTGSGPDPVMWGFTVQWEFRANCSKRDANIYQFERKLVCREICDPLYCPEHVSGYPRNPTLGSVRRKKVAVLYNAKICFQQTEVIAKQHNCYDEELFNKRLSFFSSWGGDPYPFRDHAWSDPGGSCTAACTRKHMVCSQNLPYPDVIETIAQQKCTTRRLFEEFKGIHQPGYEQVETGRPVCQGIKNKDTSLWVRAHSAKERCDATKEGFVRLCWCSKDEHVFKYVPIEPDDQVSLRNVVSRPFRPHPSRPTSWCVKFAPQDPLLLYDIFSFAEHTRNGPNRPRKSLTLSASWREIKFSQEFYWVTSEGVAQSVTRFANWSVPYSYAQNYWRSKDLIRFICVRFSMRTGDLSVWYKQPGKFMLELTPSYNSIRPYKYFLRSGIVALGRSLAISDTPTYKFGGLFLYALFTELFQKDISYAHSTYNCMIPHLYSDKPLLRRNTSHTVTWADWSPLVTGVTVTGVTVLDRFSQPDVITVKDVCGACFVEERGAVTRKVLEKLSTPDDNDTETFCDNVSRAMLLWEDNAYCWQVDHTRGAYSFETKTQPYPKMISMYNKLRNMGLDPKVSCSALNQTLQQRYSSSPLPRPTGFVPPTRTTPFTINETISYFTTSSHSVTSTNYYMKGKSLTRKDCEGNVRRRCSGFSSEHTWWYWKELFYAFPFSDTPGNRTHPMVGMYWAPGQHPRNDCDLQLFQLICLQSIEINKCEEEAGSYVKTAMRDARKSLIKLRCVGSHLQWRTDRRTNKQTTLRECSVWNLSECRWRHFVGARFHRYHFTSDLFTLWEAEINDFRYSLKEESCKHRQEYATCLEMLNCNNETLKFYNSTDLAEKFHVELNQFNFDFFYSAVRAKVLKQEWCQYPDPLNRAHSDCTTCFSLLRHLNSSRPHYWASFMDSISVYNYRDCHGPQCILPFTVVPPDYSRRLDLEDIREWEEQQEEGRKSGSVGSCFSLVLLCFVSILVAISGRYHVITEEDKEDEEDEEETEEEKEEEDDTYGCRKEYSVSALSGNICSL
ncbi:hypothetical protein ACHWQZ_G002095 [Mnemiopsis leidyi]